MAQLSRDRIVDAAVAIVDEAGPDALTMRAVAQRLGAGAMSLYRHVASREELLDLVLGSMTTEVQHAPLTGDWREDVAATARDLRAALLRRPHLTALLAARTSRGVAGLPLLERTVGILRAAGFGRRGAVLASEALANYVTGAAIWQAAGLAGPDGDPMAPAREQAASLTGELPPEAFPNLGWVGAKLAAGSADDRFEFGLRSLLDGFAAYLERRTAS